MNINNDKYIILELIPTNLKQNNGSIIQLCALKIDGLKLLDRFDYRINDENLPIIEMKSWIDYDNHLFTYTDSEEEILKQFNIFSENLPILILDNSYTKDYIKHLNNQIYNILTFLDLTYSDDVIELIMNRYKIEPSNHIVDILYEALMMKY